MAAEECEACENNDVDADGRIIFFSEEDNSLKDNILLG